MPKIVSDRKMERRQFLQSALAVAGVAATPGLLKGTPRVLEAGSEASRMATLVSTAKRLPNGTLGMGPRYSSVDGLLMTFVRGRVASVATNEVLLAVPAGVGLRTTSGTVPINFDAQSFVHARGVDVQGDTSALQLGDMLSVNTITDAGGVRLANWAIANMRIAKFSVAS